MADVSKDPAVRIALPSVARNWYLLPVRFAARLMRPPISPVWAATRFRLPGCGPFDLREMTAHGRGGIVIISREAAAVRGVGDL